DKTGTITTGEISLSSIEAVGDTSEAHAAEVLGALGASDPSPNATLQAIIAHYAAPEGWEVTRNLPFSSARKWAATEFGDRGTFYLGAPDILFDEGDAEEKARAADG
ncbi:MAG TPA: magnesium-transporting ATPase, partial [Acidimicrobiaceae bacterium]|nr:magnesium-transporting ATPase [Acidimicrobiaceae bacterium]